MIGTTLNQIRQARALELRDLAEDALTKAQPQSHDIHAVEDEHKPSVTSTQIPNSHRRWSSSTERQRACVARQTRTSRLLNP
jgi:hypothetical protein